MPSHQRALLAAALCFASFAGAQYPEPEVKKDETVVQVPVSAASRRCSANADCDRREFCNLFPACGPDAVGQCKKRPSVCATDAVSVMGCDGKTYGNACRASFEGVTIRSAR